MALWGEVPPFIRGSFARRYINRTLQLPLPLKLPAEVVMIPAHLIYRDIFGRKVSFDKWHRQPRRHPLGDWRVPVEQLGEFRRTYLMNWIAARKEQGLPYEITDPWWFPYLPAERKKRA